MKALKYKITVQDDPVHSYTKRTIQEIWIPEYNICFNEEGYVFRSDEPRNKKNKKVNIPKDAVRRIEIFEKHKENVKKVIKEIFDGTYKERENITLYFSEEMLLKMFMFAHEKDMTFNEFVEEALEEGIKEYEKNPEKFMKEIKDDKLG